MVLRHSIESPPERLLNSQLQCRMNIPFFRLLLPQQQWMMAHNNTKNKRQPMAANKAIIHDSSVFFRAPTDGGWACTVVCGAEVAKTEQK